MLPTLLADPAAALPLNFGCCLCCPQEVLDWFEERALRAYSISAGQSLLYNDIFPKHKERLGKKMSELVVSVSCMQQWQGLGSSTADARAAALAAD